MKINTVTITPILIACALLIGATFYPPCVAKAQDNSTDINELCQVVGSVTEGIMTARQAGVPLSQLMRITKKVKSNLSRTQKLSIQKIVVQAYKVPRFSSEVSRTLEIQKFKNSYIMACYQFYLK